MEVSFPFNHIFIGIGNNGSLIVRNIGIESSKRVIIDTSDYLLNKRVFVDEIEGFFKNVERNSIVWMIFERKPTNIEIAKLIDFYLPGDVMRLAYVLTPYIELVNTKKPKWAENFETVFYDSLWEVLSEYKEVSLKDAFNRAGMSIGEMFTKLYEYLENNMLVNVDYADFFAMIKGGNVGIIRLIRDIDFTWHWGIWDRGLINIMAGRRVPLSHAHRILNHFQDILGEKDIIWGVQIKEDAREEVEVLALLIKRW